MDLSGSWDREESWCILKRLLKTIPPKNVGCFFTKGLLVRTVMDSAPCGKFELFSSFLVMSSMHK